MIRKPPYQYFEGEVLTDEMVSDRIRLIYMSVLIGMMVPSSVSPTVTPSVGQTRFPSTSTVVERPTPNQSDANFKQLHRGGAITPPNRLVTGWLGKQNTPGARIMLNRLNRGGPGTPGMPGAVLTRPKPASPSANKNIKRRPVNGSSNGSSKSSTNRKRRLTSVDDEAKAAFITPKKPNKPQKAKTKRLFGVRESVDIPEETPQPTPQPGIPEKGAESTLGPVFKRRDVVTSGNITKTITYEDGKDLYLQNVGQQLFGSDYTKSKTTRVPPASLNNTFDTPVNLEKLLELATNPQSGHVTLESFYEAEVLFQFQKEHVLAYKVVNPTRPYKEVTKVVNPDYVSEGEAKVIEIKQLIGKYGLEMQNQTRSQEQSWILTGRRSMTQRQGFFDSKLLGLENANDMLNIIDLGFVEIENRTLAKEFFLKGVNQTNVSDVHIAFINDSMDASINHNITNSTNNNISDYNNEF